MQTCTSCHNLDAVQARGVTGPDLDELGALDEQRVLNAIKRGGTGQGRMPANLLSGEDAEAVTSTSQPSPGSEGWTPASTPHPARKDPFFPSGACAVLLASARSSKRSPVR